MGVLRCAERGKAGIKKKGVSPGFLNEEVKASEEILAPEKRVGDNEDTLYGHGVLLSVMSLDYSSSLVS